MSWYKLWLPLAFSAIITVGFVLLPIKPALVGEHGLASKLLGLVSIFPGFFVAALAAVSTFDRDGLDEEMPPPTPQVKMRLRGQLIDVRLTHRLFLGYLFSYLIVLSTLLSIVLLLADSASASIKYWIAFLPWSENVTSSVKILFVFMLSTVLGSVIASTLQGIYFLAERIHRPNQ
jgi:hypothetical protein